VIPEIITEVRGFPAAVCGELLLIYARNDECTLPIGTNVVDTEFHR
jgi:hypothetical protein